MICNLLQCYTSLLEHEHYIFKAFLSINLTREIFFNALIIMQYHAIIYIYDGRPLFAFAHREYFPSRLLILEELSSGLQD